jgi:hypothetical protein
VRLIRYINDQTTILGDPLEGKGNKGSVIQDGMSELRNEIVPRVKKECRKMVRLVRSTKSFLWRGLAGDDELFVIKTPRKNRYPTDTPTRIHEAFDKQYYEQYGWKPRSEGVFVSNKQRGTIGYGPAHIIFPVSRFQYTWAPEINDFFTYSKITILLQPKQNEVDIRIAEAIKKYNNNIGIDKFMKKNVPGEMMIKCKKYYAINYEFVQMATIHYPGFESEFQDMFFR